jgi:serine/threonine-protein kinase
MSEVLRARDEATGLDVALKLLPEAFVRNPEARRIFAAEVRHAGGLDRPNVVRVLGFHEEAGRLFIVIDYVDGEDLASRLRRPVRVEIAEACRIALAICAGLEAAHARSVLHRDLKPSNVLIDRDHRVRITDFGLAVAMGDPHKPGDSSGTPAYMAPERLAGEAGIVRSDLYSLGLVLYELFTGTHPFDARSLQEWKIVQTATPPQPPSRRREHLPDSVERAILRCLEKDPALRPTSAREVAAWMDDAAN